MNRNSTDINGINIKLRCNIHRFNFKKNYIHLKNLIIDLEKNPNNNSSIPKLILT